ncbi:uncharacterized protein K441DRAFT_664744 [Cenococcum geophilum 1.58]|uniref:uncharacterized protein n=1 Tax=Cenococcum geophilum 1.58 TaxID=794803 RepID=UPI00358EACF7|nr:hypothetical protein K441DRAFT_664744 [Cenococcum geophilum 1.58]
MALCRPYSVCGVAVGQYYDSNFVKLALPLHFRDFACHNNLHKLATYYPREFQMPYRFC